MNKLDCPGRALVSLFIIPHSHLMYTSGDSDCVHYTAYWSPWLMQIYVTSHIAYKMPVQASQREDNNSSTNMQNYCSENNTSHVLLRWMQFGLLAMTTCMGARLGLLFWILYYMMVSVIVVFPFPLRSVSTTGMQFSSSAYTGWDSSSQKSIINSFINVDACVCVLTQIHRIPKITGYFVNRGVSEKPMYLSPF